MRNYLTFLLIFLVIAFGTLGYCLSDIPFYDALLDSLALLMLNAPLEPTNIFVEIARWLGVIFVLNVVYSVIETAILASADDLRVKWKMRRYDAVAVHGDGIYAEKLASSIGPRAIRSDRKASFGAPIQVVLFVNERDTLEFYSKNFDLMVNAREIYVGLSETTPMEPTAPNVFVFQMPMICAQLYWDRYPVVSPEKIALIGDDSYATALLTQGLLVNIYSVEGGVQYSVFGNFSKYRALHPGYEEAIKTNADQLVFEDKSWAESLQTLNVMDRIIVCGDTEVGLQVVTELRNAGVAAPVHLRCDSNAYKDLLEQTDATAVFGTADELATSAIVLQQKQHEAGKRRAIAYRLGESQLEDDKKCNECTRQSNFPLDIISGGTTPEETMRIKQERLSILDFDACLTCPSFLREWSDSSEFNRQSNYAVAAHDKQKEKLVTDMAACYAIAPEDLLDAISQEDLDQLLEIEHIRWCRFHFLNNWVYADEKDKEHRKHPYLVPFDRLDRKTKDLDADSYHTLFGVSGRTALK